MHHFSNHLLFSSYGPLDLNSAARRKNATRENTTTLKAWLYEHRKNPYPTKGEKIMLAIITKMTLTQVSTWFANARRRLKKENKMTWSPRPGNKEEEEEDIGRPLPPEESLNRSGTPDHSDDEDIVVDGKYFTAVLCICLEMISIINSFEIIR